MGEFNGDGVIAAKFADAVRAASYAGHALGMVNMLGVVAPQRIHPWVAEHDAWKGRVDKIVGSCVFAADRQLIEVEVAARLQDAHVAIYRPDTHIPCSSV